ncbi:MAG: GDSL-type esterase/lipase family protein [Tannerella sp.]|jgi:lysophospholipase L1-like esterase|nr:GDSL-type esterase/lipase family protein [Tannerella sp.]
MMNWILPIKKGVLPKLRKAGMMLLFCLLSIWNSSKAYGQSINASTFPFVVDSLCIINDPNASLKRVFDVLDSLQAGKDTLLTIVHLGDSHVQAGFLTGALMRCLQQCFGNAGRGWVAPFRLSRSNEPDDYAVSSSIRKWASGRIVQRHPLTPLGPGGIGLHTVSPYVNFDLRIAPVKGEGYAFNKLVAYRGAHSMPLLPSGRLDDTARVTHAAPLKELNLDTDTIRLPWAVDTLSLQSTRRKPGTDQLLPAASFDNLYYGFVLSNGRPGILYHAIGVNGAMFANYADAGYLRRLAVLHPDLLIVSLGTNESFAKPFSATNFSARVADFLDMVKDYLPHTVILLTTPPECFRHYWQHRKRHYARNENCERVAQVLCTLARERGLACFDFFRATGGKGSSKRWYDGHWMARDRIHFTKEAYLRQGTLFYLAIINSITNYQL